MVTPASLHRARVRLAVPGMALRETKYPPLGRRQEAISSGATSRSKASATQRNLGPMTAACLRISSSVWALSLR